MHCASIGNNTESDFVWTSSESRLSHESKNSQDRMFDLDVKFVFAIVMTFNFASKWILSNANHTSPILITDSIDTVINLVTNISSRIDTS